MGSGHVIGGGHTHQDHQCIGSMVSACDGYTSFQSCVPQDPNHPENNNWVCTHSSTTSPEDRAHTARLLDHIHERLERAMASDQPAKESYAPHHLFYCHVHRGESCSEAGRQPDGSCLDAETERYCGVIENNPARGSASGASVSTTEAPGTAGRALKRREASGSRWNRSVATSGV